MPTKRIGAGFRYIHYGVCDVNGNVIGNTVAGPAAGAAAGQALLRLDGARTAPIAPAEPEVVGVQGDDDPMVTFSFNSADLPTGVIEMSAFDQVFAALALGMTVETLGDLTVIPLQPSGGNQPDLCLLLQRRSKKWESGVKGVKAWQGVFIPKATVTPLFSEFRQREHSPYRYGITANMADKKAWGATLSTAVNGAEAAPLHEFEGDNPVHMGCYLGDGAAVAYTLPFTAKSAAKVYVFVDGLRLTGSGTHYTATTTTVTFNVAPDASSIINILYELDESVLV